MPTRHPRPDPVPSPRKSEVRRFWRLLRLLGVFAALVAAIAVLLVTRGESELHWHMMIATALGAGLTVLVGGALMILVFMSAWSGHDEAAARTNDREDERE